MTLDLKAVEALEKLGQGRRWESCGTKYERALHDAAPELLALAKEALAAREWLAAIKAQPYLCCNRSAECMQQCIDYQPGSAREKETAYRALVSQHQSGGV